MATIEEKCLATAKKFIDVGLNQKKIDSIMSEICAPDVALEAPGVPTAAGAADGFKIFREAVFGWTDAFPDVKAALDAERAAKAEAPVGAGICEVAEAQEVRAT